MSFTQSIKEELVKHENEGGCCDYAELAGILAFACSVSAAENDYQIKLVTESAPVARRVVVLSKKLFGVEAKVNTKEYIREKSARSYIVNLRNGSSVLRSIGLLENSGVAFRVPHETILQDCCQRAFIKGAFLGGGSIANPEKRYHLEFVTRHYLLSKDFEQLFQRFHIRAKTVVRKSKYVTYFKDSENICDVLACMGANSGVMNVYNAKILKEIKNQANRVTNFESANITKMVEASFRQVEAIRKIESYMGLDALPQALADIARLRLQHTDLTLGELGEMLNPPIGKSGVNHRIRRILEIADKIEKN